MIKEWVAPKAIVKSHFCRQGSLRDWLKGSEVICLHGTRSQMRYNNGTRSNELLIRECFCLERYCWQPENPFGENFRSITPYTFWTMSRKLLIHTSIHSSAVILTQCFPTTMLLLIRWISLRTSGCYLNHINYSFNLFAKLESYWACLEFNEMELNKIPRKKHQTATNSEDLFALRLYLGGSGPSIHGIIDLINLPSYFISVLTEATQSIGMWYLQSVFHNRLVELNML